MSAWRGDPAGRRAGIRRTDVLGIVLEGAGLARGDDALRWPSALQCVARSLPHWKTLRSWLGDPRHAALQEALARRPSLLRCAARPYVNDGWRPERRLEAVRTHYELLEGRLAFLRFDPARSILLGIAGGCVEVRLEKARWLEHEGELALSLFSDDTRLYSVAFTLGRCQARTVAYVGALQGLGRGDALDIYRALTRRMHGLRPRDLLIAAFRDVCLGLDVHEILAVSDAACVARSAYFTSKARLSSSYDRAWAENGGRVGSDGFFRLSPERVRRAMSELPSRKRAEHRRRYEMLDELGFQISRAVGRASAAYLDRHVDSLHPRPLPKSAIQERGGRSTTRWRPDFVASSLSRY